MKKILKVPRGIPLMDRVDVKGKRIYGDLPDIMEGPILKYTHPIYSTLDFHSSYCEFA